MDSAKAKQAKNKATKAKAARGSERKVAQQQQQAAAAANQIAAMQGNLPGTGINPEIQAQQVAMQNQTQTFNPYHAMGAVPPNTYSLGNTINGEKWSHGED
jgi:hypothetical protein